MRSRGDLTQLWRVAALQTALTGAAAGAVGEARRHETDREVEERVAADRADAAGERWYAYLGAAFDPDRSAAHAEALLRGQADAAAAAIALERARADHVAQEGEWRAARARERATEMLTRKLGRERANRREEARLSAVSDRATFISSQS